MPKRTLYRHRVSPPKYRRSTVGLILILGRSTAATPSQATNDAVIPRTRSLKSERSIRQCSPLEQCASETAAGENGRNTDNAATPKGSDGGQLPRQHEAEPDVASILDGRYASQLQPAAVSNFCRDTAAPRGGIRRSCSLRTSPIAFGQASSVQPAVG